MSRRGRSPDATSVHGVPAADAVGAMTIALPAIALPAVTVHAAPPALITRRNASHLGMTGGELLRILREMRADPRFRDMVIARGKSFRAAPPDALVAFLKATSVTSVGRVTSPSEEEREPDAEIDTTLLRAAGYELAPTVSRARPATGACGKGQRRAA